MKIQIVFAFIIAVIFACGGNGDPKTNGTKDATNTSTAKTSEKKQDDPLAAGKKAYQLCIACHGADGKLAINGAKDFAESVLTLEERIEVITNGQGMMTPFQDILKPEEIKAAAEYTIHLGKQGNE